MLNLSLVGLQSNVGVSANIQAVDEAARKVVAQIVGFRPDLVQKWQEKKQARAKAQLVVSRHLHQAKSGR